MEKQQSLKNNEALGEVRNIAEVWKLNHKNSQNNIRNLENKQNPERMEKCLVTPSP